MNIEDVSELFGEVVRQSEQLIVAYDAQDDKFCYSNPAFRQFFDQYHVDHTDPAALLSAVYPEDRAAVQRSFERLLAGEDVEPLEVRCLRGKQDIVWFCVTPYRTVIKERPIIFLQAADITDQKENAAMLTKFASKKNAILHIISHELTGPLATIRNLSSLLNEKLLIADAGVVKLVKTIESINEQNITLLNEFLNKEFMESAQVELVKARTDLVILLRDIVEQYQNMEDQARKIFHFSSSVPAMPVNLDAPKFQQVINNLIWNAVKFTPEQGEINVSLAVEGGRPRITVSDNGIGIPPQFHDKLFDEFTPARRPGLNGEPTIGLGMHIIKTLVDWHEGTISFESREQEGTTFEIRLPVD